MMNFLETKTRRKRYEACDELHCVDEKDALPADHVPPNRRPVGRISDKTGLLAGGAYAPQIRFAPQNELRRGGFADPEH